MIFHRFATAAVGFALTFSINLQIAFAGEHLRDAIWETREAIAAGKHGQAASFVEHSAEAVDHANAAHERHQNDHIKLAIIQLKKGIKLAKHTSSIHHVEKATLHAEAALMRLEAVR